MSHVIIDIRRLETGEYVGLTACHSIVQMTAEDLERWCSGLLVSQAATCRECSERQ